MSFACPVLIFIETKGPCAFFENQGGVVALRVRFFSFIRVSPILICQYCMLNIVVKWGILWSMNAAFKSCVVV